MAHPTRHLLTLVLGLGLLGACGQRNRLPAQLDGAPYDGIILTDARKKDACVRPLNGCHSSSDCKQGYECDGCGADPCCPMCAVCYGTCRPKTPGACSSSKDCLDGSYCHFESGCGAHAGQCKPRPGGCYAVYKPVCGCDDKTYGNPCAAHWAGTNVAYKGACNNCSKTSCVVVNDCCGCKAIDANVTKPTPCPASCFQPQCDAAGLKKASAYCKQGKCFLGDAKTSCTTDADCSLVNDCCTCAALPSSVQSPYCSLKSCYVPACSAMGVPKAKAVCGALGVCTLSL